MKFFLLFLSIQQFKSFLLVMAIGFAFHWASKASPTLGCSIEISRDIYMDICRYVN